MDNMLPMIIQLVSGAVGGNAAGALMKKFSLGPVLNSILGILGGGLGGQLLGMMGIDAATGGVDVKSVVGSLASGGVGGGALIAIVGLIKSVLGRK